jgi:putative membrane protein
MRKYLMILFSVAIFSCTKNNNNDNSQGELSDFDKEFISKAGMANVAEIQMGELAVGQATDVSIRNFARDMVTDYTQFHQQLKVLAAANSQTAPEEMDSDHESLRNRMMGLSGREFDSTYIKNQVLDHQNAIALYQSEVDAGANGDVRNYASSMLPQLRTRLQRAETLAELFP